MNLSEKIKQLYSSLTDDDICNYIVLNHLHNANEIPNGKIKVNNDYIDSWNHPTLAQPTQAQLDAITE